MIIPVTIGAHAEGRRVSSPPSYLLHVQVEKGIKAQVQFGIERPQSAQRPIGRAAHSYPVLDWTNEMQQSLQCLVARNHLRFEIQLELLQMRVAPDQR